MRIAIATWIACLMLIAAGPTSRPATVSTTAEAWVARADRELPAVAVTEPSDLPLGKTGLAVAIYHASRSDARRAAASAIIRTETQPADGPPEAESDLLVKLDRAACWLAQIDDLPGATAMVAAADRLQTDRKDRREIAPASAYDRAFALIRLGRADEIGELHKAYAPLQLARTFRDGGRDDLADELLNEAHRAGALSGYGWLELADAGFFNEAMGAAAGEPTPGFMFEFQTEIAADALAAGDAEPAARVRDDLLSHLQKHPDDKKSLRSLPSVLALSVETGDRAGVTRIGIFYRDHPTADPSDGESIMALVCMDVGLTDEARVHAGRVAAKVSARIADPKTSEGDKFVAAMELAKVQARFGDVAAVNKTLASIPNPPDLNSARATQPYFDLEKAYAAAGCFEEAIRLAKAGDPEIYEWPAEMIASEMAFAGRGDEARKLVLNLRPCDRIFIYYYIAMRQVKRGEMTGLAKWIDKVPTAAERCLLNIAVANAQSGRRNRDLEGHIRDIGPHRPG